MNKRSRKERNTAPAAGQNGSGGGKWKLLAMLLLNLAIVFGVYKYFVLVLAKQSLGYYVGIMWTYLALSAVLAVAYFVYNRGMIHRVDDEQLPDTWSAEQKVRFKREGAERQRKSRWILLWLIPLIFTLAWEIVEVYLLQVFFPQWF
jgi:hypothetical protein